MMKKISFCVFILFFSTVTRAQDKCGTVEHTNILLEKRLLREEREGFEEWLKEKRSLRELRASALDEMTLIRIPVVIHIIHKGEAIGTGSNLSEEQILSQIKVLNTDFKRLNADSINTPTEFSAVAGKINIEFVLAKQDPNGQPTSGIVRVNGSKNQWTINDDAVLKSQSYWPAENYLNIWVTDLSSTLLGYAQFPISDLDGLEDAEDNRLTDGVAVDYTSFGSRNDGSFNLDNNFNQGRTAVHEIGHFFGLRHIWGDDNGACSGNGDYVSDTPNQSDNTEGCPSQSYITCNVHAMFQNYMDYTNDVCMNIFTDGQVSRMKTVLQNSPRRKTLTNSPGLYDPSPVANDLGIKSIIAPLSAACADSILPSIEIINSGTNLITSVSVKFSINTTEKEVKNVTMSLSPGETTTLSFASQTITPGSHTMSFEVLKTNGTSDGKVHDNASQITTTKPYSTALPFTELFNSVPSTWQITNPDQQTTWAVRTASDGNTTNKAVYLNLFGDDTDDAIDILTTPVFDLTDADHSNLVFDVAYARYGNSNDKLEIYALTSCQDLSQGTKIYGKEGRDLATTTSLTSSFVPSGYNQWRREVIDLSQFGGYQQVQLAFIGISDSGNNLYLDDISVVNDVQENLSIIAMSDPTPVRCNEDVEPRLTIRNNGTNSVNSFKILYSLNGAENQFKDYGKDAAILPGEQVDVLLPQLALSEGKNLIVASLVEPNGLIDLDSSDNRIRISAIVNKSVDELPLRENFDADFNDQWTIINPREGMEWETVDTNYDQSLFFNAFNNEVIGDEAWLVSPTLDLSTATKASVFIDLSYRSRELGSGNDKVASDSFQVLLSKDCGNSYTEVLLESGAETLSSIQSITEWNPTDASHWFRSFIDLSEYTGNENVRLAFVVTNGNGNDLYLDNIEFFLSDNASPYTSSDLYSIYGTTPGGPEEFYITFNLSDREPVQYELVDLMGRQIIHEQLENVLNQTYTISTNTLSSGIYIVRLRIDDRYYSQKVHAGR